ncbi:glycosyltransferase [Thermococcus peptonophilus]|uniref:glycosyltransferase n=1 Tax=Thermococcus peptonophilus TaxID=53952 RepID=UPI000A80496B
MRTLIIIPAYNEELTIGSVVALAKKYGDVLVVDDGSKDRTSQVAQNAGAIVIRHEVNKGKGAALKTGFDYALSDGYDAVVTIDADGQHNPDEIPLLLKPILDDKADLVIGSRYLNGAKGGNIPLYRRLGLWVLNTTTNVSLNGTLKITDSQSGFRAINRKALGELMKISSDGYSMESYMLVHLAEKGVRIKEVPITVRYDVPNKHKKNPLSHGFGVLAAIVADRVQETPPAAVQRFEPYILCSCGSPGLLGAETVLCWWKRLPHPGHRRGNLRDNWDPALCCWADAERAGEDGKGVSKEGRISVRIALIGSRGGIPGKYGGTETFVEELSRRLVREGFQVYVTCESDGFLEDEYNGIVRVHVPSLQGKSVTIPSINDVIATLYLLSKHSNDVDVLYYVSPPDGALAAIFGRLSKKRILINPPDGIEWKRLVRRIQFVPFHLFPVYLATMIYMYLMEYLSCKLPDVVVADSLGIKENLERRHKPRRVVYIAYGARELLPSRLSKWEEVRILRRFGLEPFGYYLTVARIVAENNIHMEIEGFKKANSTKKLVIVGNFNKNDPYSKYLFKLAKNNENILLLDPIYDREALGVLRKNAFAYIHAYEVGGDKSLPA